MLQGTKPPPPLVKDKGDKAPPKSLRSVVSVFTHKTLNNACMSTCRDATPLQYVLQKSNSCM